MFLLRSRLGSLAYWPAGQRVSPVGISESGFHFEFDTYKELKSLNKWHAKHKNLQKSCETLKGTYTDTQNFRNQTNMQNIKKLYTHTWKFMYIYIIMINVWNDRNCSCCNEDNAILSASDLDETICIYYIDIKLARLKYNIMVSVYVVPKFIRTENVGKKND